MKALKKKVVLCIIISMLYTLLVPAMIASGNGNNSTTCGETTVVDLVFGQHNVGGTVSVWNTDNNLYVKFETIDGWVMSQTHLYVGSTPPAQSAPGQLGYKHEELGGVTIDLYTIPIDTSWNTVYIAAHAVAVKPGQFNSPETGWGEGEDFGTNWAMYFSHTIQRCTPAGTIVLTKRFGNAETGVPHQDIQFNLLQGATTVASGTTDSNGQITFSQLAPGSYTLSESLPQGYANTVYNTTAINVDAGQTVHVTAVNNFLLNEGESYGVNNAIRGYKLNDANGNGKWDEGESTLAGWTIQLWQGETLLQETETNENGFYEFANLAQGTYTVKEVMQTGWLNTSPIEQEVIISGQCEPLEALTAVNLLNDSVMTALMPASQTAFTAEGRIGDLGGAATHEINIHTPPYTIQSQYNAYNWPNFGVAVPFTMNYNAATQLVTFTVDEVPAQTYTLTNPLLSDIMVRTRSNKAGSAILLSELELNGTPVGKTSAAVYDDEKDRDILWIRGVDLMSGFTLTGTSTMFWNPADRPTQSNLAYQIKVGTAICGDIKIANFSNRRSTTPNGGDDYATLRIEKVIENGGSETELFTVTISNGSSTFTREISVNKPEEIRLLPGQYTVTELARPGYSLVGYNPENGVVQLSVNDRKTVIVTNRYNGGGDNGGENGENSITEIVVLPDDALVGEEQPTDFELSAEEAAVGGGDPLPKTSGTDLLVFGLGLALATGGFVIRRRKRK